MVDARFQLNYAKWNQILEQSGGPFILGKKLTHADFWLANFISIWDDPFVNGASEPIMPPNFEKPTEADMYLNFSKNFPALKAHKERIHEIPQIKEWVAKRHQTIA